MKKLLLAGILLLAFAQKPFAQTTAPGPVEQKFTDVLCSCLGTIDQSKITDAKSASTAFLNCFMAQSDKFVDLTAEKHVNMEDQQAMHDLGVEIGKLLLAQKCPSFLKLAVKMAQKDVEDKEQATNNTTGTFKRIDTKGLNYIVITDETGSERSFLWLRPFPDSDRFTGDVSKYAGKQFKISWQSIEVYLPQAKGYYNLKEITGIEVL